MRDIILVIFILGFVVASFRRPYFMALGYVWVDYLQPQRLTYAFLNGAPVAMFMALGAFAFYAFLDDKRRARFGVLQLLLVLIILYAGANTFGWAVLGDHALEKWDWVWKGLLFSAFLPLVLTTRRRVEAAAFVMILSTAAITISAGIKTLLGGGGYGTLAFLVQNNNGLYEGSTLATVSLAFIPMALWLYRRNSIVKRNWLTFLVTAGIILSIALVTVGAEVRTGLIAGAVLVVLLWLRTRRKLLLAAAFVGVAAVSAPFLPASFVDRMLTIKSFDEEQSASTRIAVWMWTIDYVNENPLGGGFGVFRINQIDVELKRRTGEADNMDVSTVTVQDEARAFHSSFFEVLGELGYPGLLLYLATFFVALKTSWSLGRMQTGNPDDDAWYRDLGKMMTISILVYSAGAMFVGIAFQPPYYHMLAIIVSAYNIALRAQADNQTAMRIGRTPARQGNAGAGGAAVQA